MNAIPPSPADDEQAERRARHLAVCRELIEMGAELARRAFQRAIQADDQPPQEPPNDPAEPPNEHHLTYHRHASGVRQAMALENRIANDAFARPNQSAPPTPSWIPPEGWTWDDEEPDDREDFDTWNTRANLRQAAWHLTEHHPNQPEILETLTQSIATDLADHPNDHVSTHYARICQILNLPPDRSQLPPHLESQLRPPPDRPPNPY